MRKRWFHDLLLIAAAPAVLTALLEVFSRAKIGVGIQTLLSLALTWLVWLGLCLVLSFLRSFRLRWAATSVLAFLSAIIGVANRYKMRYRIEPVLFTDLYQLSDAAQTVQHLEFSINLTEVALVCLAFVVAFSLSLLLVRFRRDKRRIALPLLGLALLIAVPPICTFERVSGRTRYDLVDVAQTEGTLYTALAVENQRRALMRVDYTEQDVRKTYRALASQTPEAGADRPNIIFVLSESFTGEAWLAQYLDLTRELTPFFSRLSQTCRSGSLYVPKVGGGTSETEFEVLTGIRSQYAINPYAMGLPPMNSVAAVLRDKGYSATAIHWYSGVYYNRYNNLRRLGFTDFYTTDTTQAAFRRKGMFVCDEAHYAAALAQMKRTESRDFVFVLTMQNHGGYGYDDFRQTYGADTPFTDALSAETEKLIANYCWLLGESDRALEGFIAELEAFEEPTLLVFFGDHIAPLGEAAYAELGADLTGEEAHLTPYFIWSNQGNEAVREDLYAWQLGAQALSVAGLDDDPFLHYVQTLDGGDDRIHSLLSYDALLGKQYAYAEAGLEPETQQFSIGGDMILHGFDAALIEDAVYLRARLQVPEQKHQLSVNGQLFGTDWVYLQNGELELAAVMTGFSGESWNQSNTLTYESAQALLAQSTPWAYTTTVLPASGWTLEEDRWLRPCTLWRSAQPYDTGDVTALIAGGRRLECQPLYGLRQAGQYSVDESGHVWLAVRRGQTPEESVLYLFEE